MHNHNLINCTEWQNVTLYKFHSHHVLHSLAKAPIGTAVLLKAKKKVLQSKVIIHRPCSTIFLNWAAHTSSGDSLGTGSRMPT